MNFTSWHCCALFATQRRSGPSQSQTHARSVHATKASALQLQALQPSPPLGPRGADFADRAL